MGAKTKAAACLVVAFVQVGALSACSSSTTGAPATGAPVYARPGPYVAGVVTLHMGETLVDVWYPAGKGAELAKQRESYEVSEWLPAAFKARVPAGTAAFTTAAYRDLVASTKGPFPLVLFSHGFAGYRDQSTFLTTHLASWGFIVAAPDVLSRGLASVFGQTPVVAMTDVEVLRATVDLMKSENRRAAGPLGGRIDTTKLAVIGHSAGGFDSIQFGAQADVATYIPLAAGGKADSGATPAPPAKTSLYIVGADDAVVPPADVDSSYAAAPAPKKLVTIARSGHLVFADICLIGASQGGLTAIATSLGIPIPTNLLKLATDGCQPGALPVEQAYPVINHYVVAHLRSVFGIDRRPIGLGDDASRSFAPATITYQHTP